MMIDPRISEERKEIAELNADLSTDERKDIETLKDNMTHKLNKNEETIIVLNELISKLRNEISIKISEMDILHNTLKNKDAQVATLQQTLETDKQQGDKDKTALYAQTRDYHSKLEYTKKEFDDFKMQSQHKDDVWNNTRTELQKTIDLQAKEMDMINNRLIVLGKQLTETEEANKRVLLKTLEASKRYNNLSAQLSQAKQLLESKDKEYQESVIHIKKEYETRTKQVIADNTSRVVKLMAQVEGWKKEVSKRDAILTEKDAREKEMIIDFIKRIKDMTSDKTKLNDIMKAEIAAMSEGMPKEEPLPHETMFEVETVTPEPEPFIDVFKDITAEMEEEEIELPPPEVDDSMLEPMLERALENGDSEEQIITSLICSGYQRSDIEKTLQKIKLENN